MIIKIMTITYVGNYNSLPTTSSNDMTLDFKNSSYFKSKVYTHECKECQSLHLPLHKVYVTNAMICIS